MSKSLFTSAKTFVKNVGRHARRIFARQEKASEAWADLRNDARKLKKVASKASMTSQQKESAELTSEGRHAYNAKDYAKAEEFFRQALRTDSENCLAQTYLGHTLYKLGRGGEAAAAWKRAINMAPGSEAAEKARQKLQYLEQRKADVVKQLEDRMKEGR